MLALVLLALAGYLAQLPPSWLAGQASLAWLTPTEGQAQ